MPAVHRPTYTPYPHANSTAIPSKRNLFSKRQMASQNCSGVRKRYEARKDKSGTLEALVASEFQEEGPPRRATRCLIRLTRGLSLTCKALQDMRSDSSAQPRVAIRAAPHRRDFFERLAEGASTEKLDKELAKWLAGLDVIVRQITEFLEKGGYGRV
ncbi:hypothetical protein D9611_006150 [Ephemerocybe angulata]|uniref:Glycolipid transfer protein domain-containing protein n=1 Tax=Ephemerocybe angulata TaxID=980116 RepID=A0A8H5FLT3_9AGAR|nr:hypothetical protein D9611_006150 [Tulosesus angulatus]